MKTNFDRVSDHARRLNVPRDTAEDILQVALEKLFPNRAVIDRSRWEGWLRNAMFLCSLHHFRGVRRARRRELDVALLQQEIQGDTSPEVEAYQRECASELLGLLSRLAPERRDVVSLYLIDDLPMKEVAARLGIPENTAKDRWRLACLDMGIEWERARAKERSKTRIAAFLTAAAALLVLIWRRVARWSRRDTGHLLACAACALMLGEPAAPAPPGGARASLGVRALPAAVQTGAVEKAAPSLPELTALPSSEPFTAIPAATPIHPDEHIGAPPPPATSAQDRGRPRRHGAGATARPKPRIDMAHKHLVGVLELHRQGRTAGARDLLNLYRLTFPEDPLPQQHAKVASDLETP